MYLDITQAQWWELIPASVGAVLGAISAAIPAYLLARKAAQEVLERDKDQREADDKSKAFRAMTVLMIIANSIFTLRMMIEEMLTRSVDPNDQTPTQRRVSAVVGFSFESVERFDPGDLAIIAASDDGDLATELMRLASTHAAITSAFAEYKTLKQRNYELMSQGSHHQIEGEIIKTVIQDPQLAAKIRIADSQLESMVVQLIDMIRDASQAAFSVGVRFNAVMEKRFTGSGRPQVDLAQALVSFPDLQSSSTA